MTYDFINDPNVWAIAGLALILGVLIGMLLTVGGRRKWMTAYQDEVQTRESWQAEHQRLSQELEDREKELQERRDSMRAAPARVREREPHPA